MEITRALLEQYLRAIRYRHLDEVARRLDAGSHVAVVAHDVCIPQLLFRLGLCAAADDALAAAAEITRSGRTAEVVALATQADRLLRRAGIDPEAWERARAEAKR